MNTPIPDQAPKAGMITDHFSWQEAFHTNHREIDNEPPPLAFDSIVLTIPRIAVKLEKVRALLNVPLIVNSWYRCPQLNVAVGGAKMSDHMLGAAVDFIAPEFGYPIDIARYISKNASLIGFKQLIMEHTWVHISWDTIPNTLPKLEVLSLLEGGGYAKGLTDKQGNPLA